MGSGDTRAGLRFDPGNRPDIPSGRAEFLDWLHELAVVDDPPVHALEAAMSRVAEASDPGLEIAVRSVYGRYVARSLLDVDGFNRQCAELIDTYGSEAPGWAIWLHHYNIARYLLSNAGSYRAQPSIDKAIAVAHELGLVGSEAKSRAQAAWARFAVGDYTAASELCVQSGRLRAGSLGTEYAGVLVARMCGLVGLADHGLSIHDALAKAAVEGGWRVSSFAVIERLHLEVLAGNVDQVRDALSEVDDWNDDERQTHLRLLRAELALKSGEPEAALDWLVPVFGDNVQTTNRGLYCSVVAVAARCYLEIGDPVRAIEVAVSSDHPVALACDRLVAAEVQAEAHVALGAMPAAHAASTEALRARQDLEGHTAAVLDAAEAVLTDLEVDLSSGAPRRRVERLPADYRLPGRFGAESVAPAGVDDGRILSEVADLSHDLRNSLTSLVLAVDALDDEQFGDGVLQASISQIAGMLGRLDGLTVQAELSAAPREGADVARICRNTVELLRSSAANKGMTIKIIGADKPVETLAIAAADLRRVLENLVGNAIRHCDEGDSVTVRVASLHGEVIVNIVDDGPGMTQQEIDRVFRRGERSAAAIMSRTGGHGLGLSVVRRLVSDAKGTLDAFSAGPGFGLRIRVAFEQAPT